MDGNLKNGLLAAIDIGNSTVKCGFYQGRRLMGVIQQPTEKARIRLRLPGPVDQLRRVGIASVVPEATVSIMRQLSSLPVELITVRKCNVKLRVKNPARVGVDRVLNIKAAYQRAGRSCLVIDIGTAVTIDLCSDSGEFLGGVIMPGPKLWAGSLARTALLPEVIDIAAGAIPGKETREAIQAGLFWGTIGGIEKIVGRMRQSHSGEAIYLTGGAASFFRKRFSFPCSYCPYLVLEGIVQVLRENERENTAS
ncbi:MAG TPA: type III pantothenate kinase [bacterium]|nr:type III pantothenate kinase [bacterium]